MKGQGRFMKRKKFGIVPIESIERYLEFNCDTIYVCWNWDCKFILSVHSTYHEAFDKSLKWMFDAKVPYCHVVKVSVENLPKNQQKKRTCIENNIFI